MGFWHNRLPDMDTLGRLSYRFWCKFAEFGTGFWTGYEPWCAVWTKDGTADQQYPLTTILAKKFGISMEERLLEESMVARLALRVCTAAMAEICAEPR